MPTDDTLLKHVVWKTLKRGNVMQWSSVNISPNAGFVIVHTSL
jgi:hypothetical protein